MQSLTRLAPACALALFVELVVVALPVGARAQTCLHGPIALPGLAGAPEWFDVDMDGVFRAELHDPRWSGTPMRPLKQATTGLGVGEAQFRVLKYGTSLYLTIQSLTDDTPAVSPDSIQIGVADASGVVAHAVKLLLHTSGPAGTFPADPSAPHDMTAPRHIDASSDIYIRSWQSPNASSGGGWDSGTFGYAAVSSWLKDVAIWTNSPGVTWAVSVRIDLAPGALNLPGDPRLFVALESSKTTGMVGVANVTPAVGTASVGATNQTIVPANATAWESFVTSGTPCTSGVTLNRNDIGVWTGPAGMSSPGSLTNDICANASACTPVENIFSVTARNVPTSGLSDWIVRPRIRVAQWGSTISDVRYAPFRDVHKLPAGADVYNAAAPPTAGATLTTANGWHWLPPVVTGSVAAVTMHYQCQRGSDPYCPLLDDDDDATYAHQCVLVELGQRGSDLNFVNNAEFRNMHYAGLSKLERDATISIKGLEKVHGVAKPRDVYLYVDTRNMAPHGVEPIGLPVEAMQAATRLADNPWPIPFIPARAPANEGAEHGYFMTAPVRTAAMLRDPQTGLAKQLAALAGNGKEFYAGIPASSLIAIDRDQLLDAVYPTYRVHAYYDSGVQVETSAGPQRRLIPMVPFGYRLTHDGVLYGFDHALLAKAGATLTDLGGNWYKISVPPEGEVKLVTRIIAEEEPLKKACEEECDCKKCPGQLPPGTHCGCRIPGGQDNGPAGLLALLSLGLILWLRRRRA